MARKEIKITNFSGGISDDIRQNTSSAFGITQHFDTFSYPNRLVPYRDSENDTSGARGIVNFLYANSKLYGIGYKSGVSALPTLYEKTTPDSGTWSASSNGESSSGSILNPSNCFIEHKNYIYYWHGTNLLARYGDITSGPTTTNAWQTISFTYTAQGCIDRDGTLFLPYDNNILTVTSSAVLGSATALVLPTGTIITAICEYGNNLAIATRTAIFGRSKVYIWDKSSYVFDDVIDWGEGDLYHLSNIEGRLVGISVNIASSFATTPAVIIKTFSGGTPQLFKQISVTGLVLPHYSVTNNNKLYFPIYSTDTNYPTGIYCFGRLNEKYPFSFTMDRKMNNDSAPSVTMGGLFKLVDFMWSSFTIVSNDSVITKTNDQSSYTATSIYESQKFSDNDPSNTKKLFGVACFFAPLPASGQVVLKYRKDEETSWTTIFTETTDNAIAHDSVNIESTGANLPDFREIQFRIESTGGAEITGFKFVYDVLTDLLG